MAYKLKTAVGTMVKLDVGGKLYTTSLTTLGRYPDSMLGAMFSGRVPVQTDNDGTYLIDRDGEIFRHILNFLRTSQLHLPEDFNEYDLLMSEADFYQLDVLKSDVSKLKTKRERKTKETKEPAQYVEFIRDDGDNMRLFAHASVIQALNTVMSYTANETYTYDLFPDGWEIHGIRLPRHIPGPGHRGIFFNQLALFQDLETLGFSLVSTACSQSYTAKYPPTIKIEKWTFRKG